MANPTPGEHPPALVRRLPFFYGWIVVGVAMLSGFLGAGLNNVATGVVFKPMTEDLGWSRSLTAGAVGLGTVGAGLLAPLFGRLADRFGPRILLSGGAAIVGILVLLIALVSQPWQFYATYVPARALAQTLVFGVVPLTAVTNWFYLKRPRVVGLFAMSIPMGAALLALVYQALISAFGWRATFITLGALLCTLLVGPAALLLRRRPEDVGLLPDGVERRPGAAAEPGRARPATTADPERSWTFAEAVRSRALWLLIITSLLYTSSSGAIAFHLNAYLTDLGIEPVVAAAAMSVFSFSGGLATGLWGFLGERVPVRALSIFSFLLAGAGMVLLLQLQTPLLAFVFAAVYGVAARGQEVLLQILVAHYFGRHSFGAIGGLLELSLRVGLGVGPFIAALAFDLAGSYRGIFTAYVGVYVVAAGLVFLARRPVPRAPAPAAG